MYVASFASIFVPACVSDMLVVCMYSSEMHNHSSIGMKIFLVTLDSYFPLCNRTISPCVLVKHILMKWCSFKGSCCS